MAIRPAWFQEFAQLRRSREFKLIAPLAAIAGLLALFMKLADEALEGETHGFDQALLLAFRTLDPADPIGPPWFEGMMTDLTALGGFAVLSLIGLISIGYLVITGHRASAWLVALSGLGGTLLNNLLKLGFDRPRPDLVAHMAEVHTLSFPSGHAMQAAIMYLTLGVLLARSQEKKRLKAYILGIALLLAGLVGISRVYLGVHWPTDVLAGWCVGGAWALFCLQMLRWMTRHHIVEDPASTSVSHK